MSFYLMDNIKAKLADDCKDYTHFGETVNILQVVKSGESLLVLLLMKR
jgi:hypothetical protein